MNKLILLITVFISTITSTNLFAQAATSRLITGTVVNASSGEPLVGANVLSIPGRIGAVTDENGSYSINIQEGDHSLEFSFIGFVPISVSIGQQSEINARLEQDLMNLSDVVVVGYGTQSREDVTGSVGVVDVKELKTRTVATLDQALQGQIAGVDVTSNSGTPGGEAMVRIRGIGTLNNSNPLYVVDGMMVNDIAFLNMNDVSSVQVLKDASATAIYGSRGSNGVIIITTRKGTSGKASIDLSGYYGIQNTLHGSRLLDGPTWGALKNEAMVAAGNPPVIANPSSLETYDYFDSILHKNAPISDINVSVSRAGENGHYFFSFDRFEQDGIINRTNFQRHTLRANSSFKVKPWLEIGENLALARTSQRLQGENDEWTSMVMTTNMRDPTTNPRNDDGTFSGGKYNDAWNPLAVIEYNDNKDVIYRSLGNFYADFKLAKGLTFRSNYSFEYSFGEGDSYIPVYYVFVVQKNDVSRLAKSNYSNFVRQWTNTITYQKSFGDHNLNVMVGEETYKGDSKYNGMNVNDVPSDDPNIRFISNAVGRNDALVNGSRSQLRLVSGMARINYSFKEKYLFTTNFRADASSKFIENKNQWGYFPSFSIGWKINEESFMSGVDFVNDLKLRAGWGRIGNEGSVPPYQYVSTASSGANYVWGGELIPGFAFQSTGNPELKWEVSTTTNVGLDFGLFNRKLSGSIDFFDKRTKDMLLRVPVPGQSGVEDPPYQNAGSMKNTGVEIGLLYRNVEHAVNYSVGVNFSKINNKVLDLGAGDGFIDGASFFNSYFVTRTSVGRSIAQFYGYKTDGLFQNDADIAKQTAQENVAPGDVRYIDEDGDGELDFYYLGSPLPKFTYSLNSNIAFKGFDLTLTLTGVQGNKIFNGPSALYTRGSTVYYNLSRDMTKRWHGEGTQTDARYPRLNASDVNNVLYSDRFIEDGSYLRIKTVQLGYNFRSSLLKNLDIEALRLYFSAQNLYTFTNYTGLDPEIGMRGGDPLDINVDRGHYPVPRVFTFGLNVTF